MLTRKPPVVRKTAAKDPLRNKEPLLNAVARKLGYVAGTLTHVAQGLTGSSPAKQSAPEHPSAKRPKGAAPKVRKPAHRKREAAATLRNLRTRSRTLRKKAESSGAARSPRKRASKS